MQGISHQRALRPIVFLVISLGLASCGVVDTDSAKTLATRACMSEADAKDSDSTSAMAERARNAATASGNAAKSDDRYSKLAQAFGERSRWYEELVKVDPRPPSEWSEAEKQRALPVVAALSVTNETILSECLKLEDE